MAVDGKEREGCTGRTRHDRSADGMDWTYRPGCEGLVGADFVREMGDGGRQNMVRIRGVLERGTDRYFIKVFKHVGVGRSIKSLLFGHVAKKEFRASDYLASRGIPSNRIRTVSYGKERPVAVCNDISCWSQNRRSVTVLDGAAGGGV